MAVRPSTTVYSMDLTQSVTPKSERAFFVKKRKATNYPHQQYKPQTKPDQQHSYFDYFGMLDTYNTLFKQKSSTPCQSQTSTSQRTKLNTFFMRSKLGVRKKSQKKCGKSFELCMISTTEQQQTQQSSLRNNKQNVSIQVSKLDDDSDTESQHMLPLFISNNLRRTGNAYRSKIQDRLTLDTPIISNRRSNVSSVGRSTCAGSFFENLHPLLVLAPPEDKKMKRNRYMIWSKFAFPNLEINPLTKKTHTVSKQLNLQRQ